MSTMPFKITQETFNDAVLENMECFGITIEESIQDTITQFKSQGADLFSIMTDPEVVRGVNPVKTLKEQLLSDGYNCSEKIAFFKSLCDIIQKDMAYRVYCGKCGIYDLCFKYLFTPAIEADLINAALECLIVLLDGYPDLLDETGTKFFVSLLDNNDSRYQKYGLNLVRITCVMHEMNRQRYVHCDIGAKLARLATPTQHDDEILVLVSKVISALTLEDDLRALTPKFYNNAIGLADYLLKPLCYLLKVKKDPITQYYLLKALTAVVVNYNYCSEVENEGGLAAAMNILEKTRHVESKTLREQLVTQCYKFITSLAGNDVVKDKLMKYEIAEEIHHFLVEFINVQEHVKHALLLISKISLRTPEYGKLFFKLDFPDLIIQGLNNFPDDEKLQSAGCWCIRNMCSRNPEYHTQFLRLGTEELLNNISKVHQSCSYDAKIALQELGCDIMAREPWTGKEGDKLARE